MIPNVEKSVEVQSNITGQTGQFSVDESALGHIMDVLTNLYSDPEGAVTREYLTNAYDAQVEAGMVPGTDSWVPIKVTTPSHFNKSYKIRDFGIGMNANDLTDIYSKYGKSTKTTSNDVVGMLGLGSKCALTYTNSFTITGYKDGVKTTAIVSKNEENIPVFHIVDTCATDEPNGVEINVPVKDRNTFAEKTADFLKWWAPGLVEVNGYAPDHHDLKKIQDSPIEYVVNNQTVKGTAEVYLIEGHGYYNRAVSRLVMGNVAYIIDDEYVDEALRDNGMGFVAYIPMGAANFPPSRERLYYNSMTKKVIKDVSAGLFKTILKMTLDEVTNATDHVEAWIKYYSVPYSFQKTSEYSALTYKGDKFISRFQHEHSRLVWDYNGRGSVYGQSYINIGDAVKGNPSLVVTGVANGSKPTSYFKKKVLHYIDEKGLDRGQALLVEDDFDSPWTNHLPRVDADTIRKIKLPRNTPSGPRAEATYDYYTIDKNGVNVETDKVVNHKKIAYISPADMRETYRKSGCTPQELLKRLPSDYALVVLAGNRFDKFLRTHPHAETAQKVYQAEIDRIVDSITDAEYIVDSLGYSERDFLGKVDCTTLDDPSLVELAKLVQNSSKDSPYKKAVAMVNFASRANIKATMAEKPDIDNNISDKYPLIESVGGYKIEHVVIYCNAVYAQSQS